MIKISLQTLTKINFNNEKTCKYYFEFLDKI